MIPSIGTRELISVSAGGAVLQGTYHKAREERRELMRQIGKRSRIGVLFVNSGGDPRSASGDSAVYWAESFAACGYPSFRLDLPGLGDSDGPLAEKWVEFRSAVDSGEYARFVAGAAKNITERFGLSGVVLVGHCAGSVSAIYAASASRYVKGVVALDPYFFRDEMARPPIRQGLSELVARNWLVAQLSKAYAGVKKIRLLVQGDKLPPNANLPVLRCWRGLISAGLPILALATKRAVPRAGEFDYFRYLQAFSGNASRMAVQVIDGANHSFADNLGRSGVRQHIERWLSAHFPLTSRKEAAFAGRLTVSHTR